LVSNLSFCKDAVLTDCDILPPEKVLSEIDSIAFGSDWKTKPETKEESLWERDKIIETPGIWFILPERLSEHTSTAVKAKLKNFYSKRVEAHEIVN
jgi:hypothetical protein